MFLIKAAIVVWCLVACEIDGKILVCDEYLDDPIFQEDELLNKKCTFSYVAFNAFDDVNISSTFVKEVNYDDEVNEIDVSHKIEIVEFANSRFPHLPNDLFERFVNLKKVSCNGVELTSLRKSDFRVAGNIEEFSANSNYIKSLGKMLFNGSKKLEALDLSVNVIGDIDGSAFSGLKKLKKLLLFDNGLRILSNDVFKDLISLEEINLSSNQIRVLDERLFENCKLLSYLYLNDNRIQKISDGLLSSIKEINFLEISNNEISELRLNISASALYANHNQLTSVKLNSVGYLSFFNNSISSITFNHKLGVISLNVSTNLLNAEALSNLVDLSMIRSLDLSFNNLGTLNVSTFLEMPKLEILNLQSTNLKEIAYGLFTHQTSLEQLDLSYNMLSSFELRKLSTARNLTTLFIEGNRIKEIDYQSIKNILPALKFFGFSDNAWECSYLSSLIAFIERNEIEIYILVTEKTMSNVGGVACSESGKVNETTNYEDKSLSVNPIRHHQLLSDRNELLALSGKVETILRDANETKEKFVGKTELANELNMIKSAVASLRQDLHDLMMSQSDNSTSTDTLTVANETMSLLLQKLQYDQKIIGLETEVKTIQQSITEIRSHLNLLSDQNSKATTEIIGTTEFRSLTASKDDNFPTQFMITIIFVIACGFTIIYIVTLLDRRRAWRFNIRRAHSDTETLNENVL